jgi:penicillin G amidase
MKNIKYALIPFTLICLIFSGCALVGRGFPECGPQSLDQPGVSAPVRIDYDERYIPHIRAQNAHDAFFALGYAQAGARLFQLDMFRHLSRGEVAKIAGQKALIPKGEREVSLDMVEVDAFLKVMDFPGLGQRLLKNTSPERRALFEAYADGINAFVEANKKCLSLPYSAPGRQRVIFKKWTSADSASILGLMAWILSKNADEESFAILALQKGVPVAKIVDLIAPYYPLKAKEYEYFSDLAPRLRGVEFMDGFNMYNAFIQGRIHTGPMGGASNNWAVAGNRTYSGRPIFANDPHLGTMIPSFWFFAHVKCPEYNIAGAFSPGIPAALVGHNGRTAWGATMSRADITDFAVETVDPVKKTYRLGEKELPLTEKSVVIQAGKESLTRTLYAAGEGRLITALKPGVTGAVSLHWAGWRARTSVDAGFDLMQAMNVRQMMEAGSRLDLISINLVGADAIGNIGWIVTGGVPEREGYTGLLPKDGVDPAMKWNGFVPYKERAGGQNPARGYIATANNRPDSPYADNVSLDYIGPYRYERICELVESKEGQTLEDHRRWQADVHARQADMALPIVLSLECADPDARAAMEILRAWDRQVAANSSGALMYQVFLSHFALQVLGDMPQDVVDSYFCSVQFNQHPIDAIWRKDTALWADDVERDKLIRRSLAATVRELKTRFSGNWREAVWGDLHRLHFHHPLAVAPLVGRKYRLDSMPYPGDSNTINSGGYRPGKTYDLQYYSSIRFLIDMAEPDKARIVYPTGQSENPNHPSFDDMLDTWYRVEDFPLPFAEKDLDEMEKPSSLILKPAGK